MKRLNISFLLLLLSAVCMWSCYEDKGHYDYDWTPEVFLTPEQGGFKDIVMKRGQRLTVVPQLRLLQKQADGSKDTVEFRPEDFSYQWLAYQSENLNTAVKSELAVTQNLDTTIYLEIQNDPYNVVYNVTEKATGVTYSFRFKLKIATRYENGWCFLTEDDNQMVDVTVYGKEVGVSGDNAWVYERGVLEHSGFPYRGGGAKFVYYHGGLGYIYVGTGEATGWLGKTTLTWTDKQLVRHQMAMPESVVFENVVWVSGIYHFIAPDGSIYPMDNNKLILASYNTLPPATTGNEGYQKVRFAPFVGGSQTGARALVYDETNNAMLLYKASSGSATGTPVALTGEARLLNRKIYFMQRYKADMTVVIAKDNRDGKYYEYLYDAYTGNVDPKLTLTEEITNGPMLEQAEHFVCEFSNGFFYMSIGRKLYVLQRNELKEVQVSDPDGIMKEEGFQGFDDICMLTRNNVDPDIIVGTYAGTELSGKVYILQPNPVEATQLKVKTYHSDMERVKGISKF